MPTRYVPLNSFDRMERLVDGLLTQPGRTQPRGDRQIPVDAFSRDDDLVLLFDLPGVPEDSVELSLERRTLTVRAERPYTPEGSEQVFFAERPWGRFSRQIVLGDALDTGRIQASFDNGVLTVRLPQSSEARTRRIDITHAPLHADARPVAAEGASPAVAADEPVNVG